MGNPRGRGASLSVKLVQLLRFSGEPCVEVPSSDAKGMTGCEEVVASGLRSLDECSQLKGTFCGPGPFGARVRL